MDGKVSPSVKKPRSPATILIYRRKTKLMKVKNYKSFRTLQEVRRPKKCPVLSFKPVRDSETYQDMIGMGWIEVIADNPAGILAMATDEERSHRDRMGNLSFYHPVFKGMRLTRRASGNAPEGYPHFNIKHDGAVRVNEGPNNSAEFPRLNTDLTRSCMTIEDYIYKMSFLIKYAIRQQGFPVTDTELYSSETYKELIQRKMKDDPTVIKHFKDAEIPSDPRVGKLSSSPTIVKQVSLPPSLKDSDLGQGSSILKGFGLFGGEEEN
jgi:hypothetical protein